MSNFWSGWIIVLTLACLVLAGLLLYYTRKNDRTDTTDETTGHAFDGIEELDNPLPKWWLWLFVATFVFAGAYLVLYPGLGYWQGLFGWSSDSELTRAQTRHARRFEPLYEQYFAINVETLARNPKALQIGERLFNNNCATCHGSDARGGFGFPNLTDTHWLYGGTPTAIKTTLIGGRQGQMPSWSAIIGETGVRQVASYVRTLSQLPTDANEASLEAGAAIFSNVCSVCHGPDGKGNQTLGAPNLTSNVWLYGSDQAQLEYTIRKGRNGVMPAWLDILGEHQIHLLTAYVYSLSLPKEPE